MGLERWRQGTERRQQRERKAGKERQSRTRRRKTGASTVGTCKGGGGKAQVEGGGKDGLKEHEARPPGMRLRSRHTQPIPGAQARSKGGEPYPHPQQKAAPLQIPGRQKKGREKKREKRKGDQRGQG